MQVTLDKAKEEGDMEEVNKQSKRLVKVTKDHVEDVKVLLKHMGIPFISAPCEAEAQCAELVKGGKVYAAGTEVRSFRQHYFRINLLSMSQF